MKLIKFKKSQLIISLFIFLLLILAVLTVTGSLGKNQIEVALNNSCSLDNLGGATKESPNQYSVSSLTSSVTFQGWIANAASGQSPEMFTISLADDKNYVKWSKKFKTDFPRPDVLVAYGVGNEMLVSGFNASADLVKLVPGTYTVLLQGQYSGNRILCSTLNTLVIKD